MAHLGNSQSTQLPRSDRGSVWLTVARIVFTSLVGPLIGSLGVFLVTSLPELLRHMPPWDVFFDTLKLLLVFGWLFGVIPATLGAFAMIPLTPRRCGWVMFVAQTALVGALASLAGLFVFSAVMGALRVAPGLLLVGVPAGAVSLVLCTLPFDMYASRRVGMR